jgi:hypothetical protein
MIGKNALTRVLLSMSVMWFAVNVFIAPHSVAIRQEILKLGRAAFR